VSDCDIYLQIEGQFDNFRYQVAARTVYFRSVISKRTLSCIQREYSLVKRGCIFTSKCINSSSCFIFFVGVIFSVSAVNITGTSLTCFLTGCLYILYR